MPNTSVPITAGVGTNIDTFTMPNGDHRQTVVIMDKGGYQGRASNFRMLGRASGTRQTLQTLWNGVGSGVDVDVTGVNADFFQTAVKAVTLIRPILRLYKITVAPTGGTTLTKVSVDSSETANSLVTSLGDASADGTNSTTALAFTTNVGIITQEYAPQLITAAGYEVADRIEFLTGGTITLKPGEGVAVCIDYTTTTANPATDMWITTLRWEEYIA